METYSLWHTWMDQDPSQVCMYVTAINVQEIGSGSRAFIDTILTDLSLSASGASKWSISAPFATSYLADESEQEDWRDTWWLTWEIRVSTDSQADGDASPDRVVDTFAYDESWTGEESKPEAFVIVARYADGERAAQAKRSLSAILVDRVGDPDLAESDLVERVAQRTSTTMVTVDEGPGGDPELLLRMERGKADAEQAAATATMIEEIVRKLGGKTRFRP